jgi:hypothetical protein
MKKMLTMLILALLAACTQEASFIPETNLAEEYTIVKESSYPTPPDKSGLEVIIFSNAAATLEQRAQTAIKADLDILNDKGLYEVTIKMSASPNIKQFNPVAHVQFNPHKKNTWGTDQEYVWDVTASPRQISNGKIIENGKSYSLDYLVSTLEVVLKK